MLSIVLFFLICTVCSSYRISRLTPSYRVKGVILSSEITPSDAPKATSAIESNKSNVPFSIKSKLAIDMKDAMKSKQKNRLSAIRSIQTAIKQKEVDERVDVSEEGAIAIMTKIVKQRRESIKSYSDAGRADLAQSEQEELDVILSYMPQPLTAEEVEGIIAAAISSIGATTVKDMGKVMSDVRPKLSGKADMAQVGEMIKKKLGGK